MTQRTALTEPAMPQSRAVSGTPTRAARVARTPVRWRVSGLLAMLGLVFIASFMVGRFPVPAATVCGILLSRVLPWTPDWPADMEVVVLSLRLPRVLAAMLVGGALSVAGSAYQGLFRNPMVSPGILGVSAGAGLGAALAILLGWGMAGIQAGAFAVGLLAVAITWGIGAGLARRGDPVLVMVLSGVIVGTLFTALVSLVKFVADPNNTLPTITFWLMGSLASVSATDLAIAAVPVLAGMGLLLSMGWNLNVLCLGDDEARALGLATARLRLLVILGATLATAGAVAISGIIGLVGLIVPHLARLLVGPDHRRLLPVSALIGSGFLLVVDDLARSLFPVEVPLGIVTSVIGAPFFLYLLARSRRSWA